jgi:hypothetical protein
MKRNKLDDHLHSGKKGGGQGGENRGSQVDKSGTR